MLRFCLASCTVLALVLVIGCTSPPKGAAPAAKVSGIIKMDQKPVPTGELHFSVPGYPPTLVEIKDGNFSGDAPIGKNKVEFIIFAETPKTEKGAVGKNIISPQKYWGPDTVLEATVKEKGPNDFKFDLSSK